MRFLQLPCLSRKKRGNNFAIPKAIMFSFVVVVFLSFFSFYISDKREDLCHFRRMGKSLPFLAAIIMFVARQER